MSKQDLQRVEVLTEVLAGSRMTKSAAGVLGVSLRQAQRLVARYRDGGGGALIHKSQGRPASNKLASGVFRGLSKGRTLPYRLFSKDQRVSHTAVVENKRLSHALNDYQGTAGRKARAESAD